MAEIKLEWLNKNKMNQDERGRASMVYGLINSYNQRGIHPTGRMLANRINTTQQDIRKDIQNIRQNNADFDPKRFLVAGHKGYYLTSNKVIINKFAKKTHLMAQHKLQQVEQAYKASGKKGW